MRIVQVANFVHETSGGLRTALDALGAAYVRAGHDVMVVRPGRRYHLGPDDAGRTAVELPGPPIPSAGGYRVLLRRSPVASIVACWRPDVVEVNDKTTLGWMGAFARQLGATGVLVSHERLDHVVGDHLGSPRVLQRAARWHQRRFLPGFDAIVCASRYAAAEFEGLGGVDRTVVPFGVDLELFHPDRRHDVTRSRPPARAMLVSRLTKEKQPLVAAQAVAELRWRGVDVELLVAGDGPLRDAMLAAAPAGAVCLLGHVADRRHLAALVADADVVISPGRRETFGLAALEALACGTPLVTVDEGALPELLAPGAGRASRLDASSFADAITEVLQGDRDRQRAAARDRALQFHWGRTAATLLGHYAALLAARPPVRSLG